MKKFPPRSAFDVPDANPIDIARREFLSRAAAAGMAMGLPPLLSSCGGNSTSAASPATD